MVHFQQPRDRSESNTEPPGHPSDATTGQAPAEPPSFAALRSQVNDPLVHQLADFQALDGVRLSAVLAQIEALVSDGKHRPVIELLTSSGLIGTQERFEGIDFPFYSDRRRLWAGLNVMEQNAPSSDEVSDWTLKIRLAHQAAITRDIVGAQSESSEKVPLSHARNAEWLRQVVTNNVPNGREVLSQRSEDIELDVRASLREGVPVIAIRLGEYLDPDGIQGRSFTATFGESQVQALWYASDAPNPGEIFAHELFHCKRTVTLGEELLFVTGESMLLHEIGAHFTSGRQLDEIELSLLIGGYVQQWQERAERMCAVPSPSPMLQAAIALNRKELERFKAQEVLNPLKVSGIIAVTIECGGFEETRAKMLELLVRVRTISEFFSRLVEQ